MGDMQDVKTPLVETGIELEPKFGKLLRLPSVLGRTWSLLFGKRDTLLQPLWASKAGALAIQPINLSECEKVAEGAIDLINWTDIGSLVDFVLWEMGGGGLAKIAINAGVDGLTATVQGYPDFITMSHDVGTAYTFAKGCLWGRVRYLHTVNGTASSIFGCYTAYRLPTR